MLKSGSTGDGGKRQVGFNEQLPDSIDFQSCDFFVRRPSQDLPKPAFKTPSSDGNFSQYIADVDPFPGVLSNEPNGRSDIGVVNSERVC